MIILFTCPHCQTTLQTFEKNAGSSMRCLTCDHDILIPVQAEVISTLDVDQEEGYAPAPVVHSGWGIASVIIAGVCIAIILTAVIAMVIIDQQSKREDIRANLDDRARVEEVMVEVFSFCTVIFSWVGSCVGLGLGINGVRQRHRKKVTAVIGVILNSLVVMGGIGMLILGGLLARAG